MNKKIKKRYYVYIDCYGKLHREHRADGVCQMCGKSEGVVLGDRIRCRECVDKIIKVVKP